MNEQFDTEDDHRMYDLEHLRSETTMIERPTTLPTPSSPGEVGQPSTAIAEHQSTEVAPPAATQQPAHTQINLATVAAACLASLVVFVACFLIVRYAS